MRLLVNWPLKDLSVSFYAVFGKGTDLQGSDKATEAKNIRPSSFTVAQSPVCRFLLRAVFLCSAPRIRSDQRRFVEKTAALKASNGIEVGDCHLQLK